MNKLARIKYFINLLGFIPLLPIIIFQAFKVKSKTLRLPVAEGSKQFISPDANLSLLHIGESTVAGVGVSQLDHGLTKAIVNRMKQTNKNPINWHILAENGATLSQLNQQKSQIHHPDVLLITIGVNDTTKFTSAKCWAAQIKQCVEQFSGHNSQVFFTQIPDITLFPALPFPLNRFLGLRSQLLDQLLRDMCEKSNWHFIEASLPIKPEWMAIDGYHPNQAGYQIWGNQISKSILKTNATKKD